MIVWRRSAHCASEAAGYTTWRHDAWGGGRMRLDATTASAIPTIAMPAAAAAATTVASPSAVAHRISTLLHTGLSKDTLGVLIALLEAATTAPQRPRPLL